jgi:hypothetical protein
MDETEVHAAQLSMLLAALPQSAATALDDDDNYDDQQQLQQCQLSDELYQTLSELLDQAGCTEALDRSCSALLSAAYPTLQDARRALLLLERHLVVGLAVGTPASSNALREVSAALSRLATYGLLTGTAALGCSAMEQWQWFRACDLPTVMQQWLQVSYYCCVMMYDSCSCAIAAYSLSVVCMSMCLTFTGFH